MYKIIDVMPTTISFQRSQNLYIYIYIYIIIYAIRCIAYNLGYYVSEYECQRCDYSLIL